MNKKPELPFRISKKQAAELLGFKNHEIPILIANKMLHPLGKPAKNAPKSFSTVEIMESGADPEWMNKAMKAIQSHWKKNHERRKK